MMQHVATAKSEVAAFATDTGHSSLTEPHSNEQFGKLLHDQKSKHASVTSSETPYYTARKNALQASTDEAKEVSSCATMVGSITPPHGTSSEHKDSPVTGTSELSHHKPSLQPTTEEIAHENSEIDVANAEVKLADGTASIVAQEWVSLVDNLQKLAGIEGSTKKALADVTGANLKTINKLEKDQLEKNSDSSMLSKEKIELNLSMLVDQAVGKAQTKIEREGIEDADLQQKTVELLLEQTDVLQEMISQLQTFSQGSDIEMIPEADLTLAENTALLRSILIDSDKTLEVLSVESLLPMQTQQSAQEETPIPKLESVALQSELVEQDLKAAHVLSSNIFNSNKLEKLTSSTDIKNILNLTDDKLDRVLDNIAQRLFDSKKTGESVSPEQIAQQLATPKMTEAISTIESQSKNFISALKSGLEEYKDQLSQGREPGIDLKALVSDALAKTSDNGVTSKAPINFEQMVKNVSQVLDFAQTINRTIEHNSEQTYNVTSRDIAQIQGEQSKQIQLNQFESKFDKAINIAKPEGHQQLAEKVRWMMNTKNLVAEIRLDPAELGSMHVKVVMTGESATVNFVVQSQQARDAVDNATPRLKEMLAEKGIELGQSSVRQQSDGQQGQDDRESAKQSSNGSVEAEDVDMPEQVLAQQNIVNGALGGIDYFV